MEVKDYIEEFLTAIVSSLFPISATVIFLALILAVFVFFFKGK